MNVLTGLLKYETIAENFSNGYFVADYVISILFVLAISGFIAFLSRRIAVYIGYGALCFFYILFLTLNLPMMALFMLIAIFTATIICTTSNAGVFRKYVTAPMKSQRMTSEDKGGYDKEKMINNICSAVKWLSDNKTGALITFERNTPMDEFMKNGTMINCPITPEIIETIFYEGSRLHDGAIIIRKDVIISAAVYYPSSTKAIVGKFGARHRAALGISELTDSVTVVVSEETGRISIAHGGMIDNVKLMEFEKIFRDRIA